MAGIPASFNPYTLLDGEDSGDRIGKASSKGDEAKKREVPTWVNNRAMHSSTPAKKKNKNKKKKPTPAPSNPAANNGKGTASATGKQNGEPNANRNGASNNGGGSGAPMKKDQQQQPAAAAVEDAEARRLEQEPEEAVPVVPTFGLWFEKSAAKKAGASGAKASNATTAAAAELPRDATTSGT